MKNNCNNNIKKIIIGVLVLCLITCTGCTSNEATNSNNVNNNSNTSSNTMTFDDYTKLLENKNIEELINTESSSNAILDVYLKNGQAYISFKDETDLKTMGLADSDIEKIKNLTFDSQNRYKLPLNNIIMVDAVKVGQDGSWLILFEDSNGKVYSFHGSQTGAFNYPLFNGDTINIKEETNLKNIIKFGSYTTNDSIDAFGIDINGNIIYR